MAVDIQINYKSTQVEEAKEQIQRQKMPKAGRGKKWFIMPSDCEFWKNQEKIKKLGNKK